MLPPTSTTANYQFKGFPSGAVWKGNSLNAEECSGKICDDSMVPINTDKDAVPSVPSQTWQVAGAPVCAPACLDVGLCGVDVHVRVWHILPPVRNAGMFVRMLCHQTTIPIKKMMNMNCDFSSVAKYKVQ